MNKKEPGYKKDTIQEDRKLIEDIRDGKEGAFEKLFKRYYKNLCVYALKYIPDELIVEDLVQEMFQKLWEKRDNFYITTSLDSYLFRSIHNLAINYINHEKIKNGYKDRVIKGYKEKVYNDDNAYWELDLETIVNKNIEDLPDRRRQIFKMSRFEDMKNQEIADKLNVSIKTVEAQMTQAIKFLRDRLKDYVG